MKNGCAVVSPKVAIKSADAMLIREGRGLDEQLKYLLVEDQ
jgi:hypothetical protein